MKAGELKTVFMGTPEFAVGTLQGLIDVGVNLVGVYTQPDRPKGRGKKLARWASGKGQVRTAPLLDDGRIQFVSDCWYVRYRDASHRMQRKSAGCRARQAAEKVMADNQPTRWLVCPKWRSRSRREGGDH